MEDPLIQSDVDTSDDAETGVQGAAPSLPEVQSHGYASRKLMYAAGTSLLIFVGGLVYAYVEGFRGAYQTMIGGLISTLAVYTGASVTNRHLVSKHQAELHAINTQAGAGAKADALPPRVEPLPPE